MFHSTRKSRRHRNPQNSEDQKKPFFSKANDGQENTAVSKPFFQAKLAIGQPGDKYEQEADAVADKVVNDNGQAPVLQRQAISTVQKTDLATPVEDEKLGTAEARMEKDKLIQEKPELQMQEEEEEEVQMQPEEEEEPVQMQEEEEEVQMQPEEEEEEVLQTQPEEEEEPVQMQEEEEEAMQMQEEEEEEIQAKSNGTAAPQASSNLSGKIESSKGRGNPMPNSAKAEMENSFGADFSGVNIHTDQSSVELNKTLGAQAFTHGRDVYFNAGKFRPESADGKHLLAHELTHVVQQGGGRQKTIQRQPAPAAKTLKSPRFNGDPVLDEVLNGKRLLKSGETGDHVTRIQQGLIDGGHPLTKFGADGQFGSETKKAVIAFQKSHGLGKDGVIGANTMGALDLYLSISPGPLPLPPEKGSTLEALKILLAKGAAMTSDEAKQARDLLFQLNNDEFKIALKDAMTNGSFFVMFGKLNLADMLKTATNLVREVVIPVTLLKPAADTVDADFKRANEIYNPHNLEIEKGNRMDIEEKETKKIIGNDLNLDEFTSTDATKEELELIKRNRVKGRMTGYWVPDMTSSRGETIDESLGNLPDDRISVVTNSSGRAQDTFAHEVGHALGLGHDIDPNNLMAGGNIRNITGAGIDKLTDAQIATIRASLFIEIGKKGLGK